MVNVGLSWSSMLGVVLVVAGASLYFLRSMRPSLARDHDIFFAAVALLCGGILFFQGWRQDPILQFGQFLLTGSVIFFAVESIRLRKVATEQAKRNNPVVDEERPVSRVYRAELDELSPYDEKTVARRIRGSRDRSSEYEDDLEEDISRRPPSRNRPPTNPNGGRPPRNPSTSRRPRPRPEGFNGFRDEPANSPMDRSGETGSNRPSRPVESPDYGENFSRHSDESVTRPPRKRPSVVNDSPRSRPTTPPDDGDYVDYQPIDYSEGEEQDNSSNFDD